MTESFLAARDGPGSALLIIGLPGCTRALVFSPQRERAILAGAMVRSGLLGGVVAIDEWVGSRCWREEGRLGFWRAGGLGGDVNKWAPRRCRQSCLRGAPRFWGVAGVLGLPTMTWAKGPSW